VNLLPKFFNDRRQRGKWAAGLTWFRLRYREAAGPTRCINLLSRPEGCGRVALYYLPGDDVSQLYVGLPEGHVRLIQRMAEDFGFTLKPKPPGIRIPAIQRMALKEGGEELPWSQPFMAHIANGFALVGLVGDGNEHDGDVARGSYYPQPAFAGPGCGPAAWHLPVNPPPGLTTRPSWDGVQPPAHLVANEPDPRRWLLGRSQSGVPLQVAGRINIYGRREAAADWLVNQVAQMVAVDYANLVVIDGAGDLVPKLKRKAAVTRLLGEQLAYVDIDGASLADGFNPLAAAPGESEEAVVERWQRWFQGMNVHPQGIHLLFQAQRGGVEDIPSLRKWLKQAERQGEYAAVSSLGMALNQLTAGRSLREWLDWPTNRFDVLPEGALFFAVKGKDWARRQLLRAAVLGVLPVQGVRLIIHGFPWRSFAMQSLGQQKQLIVSNGPQLSDGVIVLVESSVKSASMLAERFFSGEPGLTESLHLLQRGEGIVIDGSDILPVSWSDRNGS